MKQAATIDPKDVRIWYCLGLTHLAESKSDLAVEDFKQAIKLNPANADSHYYLGSLYRSLKEYDQAIQEFEEALRLNPLHASAQFGLASALQRSGKIAEAREHLKRFQTITQTKVGTPLAVTYGEQGDYATVQNMRVPEAACGCHDSGELCSQLREPAARHPPLLLRSKSSRRRRLHSRCRWYGTERYCCDGRWRLRHSRL